MNDAAFERWLEALEQRHLADLTFSEVVRGLRALSSNYVERRQQLSAGALEGAGKRAAFALFYGPLHFLLIAGVVRQLTALPQRARALVDLGCGGGAAGAAWACAFERPPSVVGLDRSRWARHEAAWTYARFGLRSWTVQGDLVTRAWPSGPGVILAAFTVNELAPPRRNQVLQRLLEAARREQGVLVIEPLARSATSWWDEWRRAFVRAGGRGDEWRLAVRLPPLVARLDRAAGLDHRRELTGRSLWLPAGG